MLKFNKKKKHLLIYSLERLKILLKKQMRCVEEFELHLILEKWIMEF